MHDFDPAQNPGHDYQDPAEGPSMYRIVRALSAHKIVIGLGLAAVALVYAIIAAVVLLRAPSQRIVTLPFRLDFSGAGEGRYPNGLKFSSGDIVAGPVTVAAYKQNQLDRFMPLNTFMHSLVVIESNQALEQLTADYRARLADPRLSPVDRERLTAEFQQKLSSLNKNEWALAMTIPERNRMPPTLANKALHDVLRLWAQDAAVTRKVLQHRVPTLTAAVFTEPTQDDIVISLVRLRTRIGDVLENIARLSDMPGAELARTARGNVSLVELELLLMDLLRTEIEPLIVRAIQVGAIRNPATIAVLEAQRDFDVRQLDYANRRAEILRAALEAYVDEQPQRVSTAASPAEERFPNERGSRNNETVMPQLDASFLDRLVGMANSSADREYRQRVVDEIRTASLATLPLQSNVAFDEQVIAHARRGGGAPDAAAQQEVRARYAAARARAIDAVNSMNEIYVLLSRNLQPSSQLYSVTGPATARNERAVSLYRIALGGAITMLLAIPLLVIGALLHDRFVREEVQEHERDAAAHPAH